MVGIIGGTIHDGVRRDPYRADILIENGKIKAMGENLSMPEGTKIIDAEGLFVYPGFVEAHCHLGLDGYGIGYEGQDYNEMNDITAPQLRAVDSFNPLDPSVKEAARAGVTTVMTGPGSANVLGGTFIAVKTRGCW